ncbi:pantetheine-phosphate adenylyltransferase [Hydrogenophaga sp. PAMC20947]|uniref:pantetheine-phosphate adenylyltransferase n=1 Tax=Hydrogenophaga sp. PAMC20947 TaxID=2565558 RepID=UPI00109D9DBD|nr:pantetheine-phosphate adenylyltransferase [Hydrogenophaga sp. PAMC20947]QCB46557.1 pantetheine-phosphate adenylyltransferase [Hydrogenophaga sp. PAMC20947]
MSSALSPADRGTRIAVYSGTFDPLTLGHEDVVRRSAGLFDEVILAVAKAHHKKTRFSLQERMAMAAEATSGIGRIRVLPFEGLIMDFCREHGASAVVRGIRNITDFDYEAQMAAMNRKLYPAVETVFLLPQADLQCISSTLVREISMLGGDVSGMVSAPVARCLKTPVLQA